MVIALSEKVDKWILEAKAIEEAPIWLVEGDTVEIIYGNFEKVVTDRKDRNTGRAYQTNDFKIGVKLRDGTVGYRLVSKYLFVDIIKAFKDEKKAHDGETLTYRRPLRRR